MIQFFSTDQDLERFYEQAIFQLCATTFRDVIQSVLSIEDYSVLYSWSREQ